MQTLNKLLSYAHNVLAWHTKCAPEAKLIRHALVASIRVLNILLSHLLLLQRLAKGRTRAVLVFSVELAKVIFGSFLANFWKDF